MQMRDPPVVSIGTIQPLHCDVENPQSINNDNNNNDNDNNDNKGSKGIDGSNNQVNNIGDYHDSVKYRTVLVLLLAVMLDLFSVGLGIACYAGLQCILPQH
jgi:hypothetical protein